MNVRSDASGVRGILATAARLDRWLQVVMVLLVVSCAMRYVSRHGLGAGTVLVLVGALALGVAYATPAVVPGLVWWPTTRVLLVVLVWAALCAAAPSFAWCAVPVAFTVLRVLGFGWAIGTIVLMTALVSASSVRIAPGLDPTLVMGPVGIALVTVIAYRALERESRSRQDLLDQLIEAQADLVEEQHRSGALAERGRLSREIHDSVGQGLSTVNLLLNAAQQEWEQSPGPAREHVRIAAATARDALDDVRRVVRDLAVGDTSGVPGDSVPAALRRAAALAATGVEVEVFVHGDPVPLGAEVVTALVRTTRGALANVREYAAATRAAVTLTYQPDEVRLDIRDDGVGFDPHRAPQATPPTPPTPPGSLRGRGLRGIRDRAANLGGQAEVESVPGEGTTVSVRFPVVSR